METTMINNSSRMALIFKKLMIEQHKTLLFLAGGYLGICLVFGLWFGFLNITPGRITPILYTLLAGLVCSIVASKTFFELVNKEGRISFFMTPASMADKFLTRVILEIPAMLILTFLGYVILTGVMILTVGTIHGYWAPYVWAFELFTREDALISILSMLGAYLLTEGWFILGSVLWPKKSFLKSVVLMTVIQMILTFIIACLIESGIMWGYSIEVIDERANITICFIISVLVSAGMIYGAYARLKRTKVIS